MPDEVVNEKQQGSVRDQVKAALAKQAKDGLLAKVKELEAKKLEAKKVVRGYETEIEKLIAEFEADQKLAKE